MVGCLGYPQVGFFVYDTSILLCFIIFCLFLFLCLVDTFFSLVHVSTSNVSHGLTICQQLKGTTMSKRNVTSTLDTYWQNFGFYAIVWPESISLPPQTLFLFS